MTDTGAPTTSSPHASGHAYPAGILTRLVRQLMRRPYRVVVVDDQRRWRGVHLFLGALFLASAIKKTTPNERVGIMLPTSGMFPMALIAVWLLRRTAVPLNYLLKPAELEYVIRDAELDTVITVQPMIERFGELPEGVTPLYLESLKTRGLPRPRLVPRPERDRTAVLIYTSGTSGRPKGVELTEGGLAANVLQCAAWGRVGSRDVFLGVLPQFHCFGLTVLTLLPLSVGGKVIYSAQFQPRRILSLIRDHRPTGFVGIPAMYNALLALRDAGPEDFRSFRYLISGGEPLPDRIRQRFERRYGITILQGYGLTETGPVVNWLRPEDGHPGSVGKTLPGVEEQVVDSEGKPLAPGEVGEIRVRGPNIMKGYFRLPAKNAEVFDGEGYFHTGDLGRFDESGNLFITGRMSDLIIVAGENVFPREVEEVLNAHPAVADSSVVGVPDPNRGEVPVAFVELADGEAVEEIALRSYCREHLAGYKVPRAVRIVEKLPRTATGKVARKELPVDQFVFPAAED